MAAAADPQQSIERHACRGGGSGIESVVDIHQRAEFFPSRGLRQGRQQQCCASRRGWTVDFRHRAAREIQLRNTGGKRFLRRLVAELQDIGESAVEYGLERGRGHVFAFSSPVLKLCSRRGRVSNWLWFFPNQIGFPT